MGQQRLGLHPRLRQVHRLTVQPRPTIRRPPPARIRSRAQTRQGESGRHRIPKLLTARRPHGAALVTAAVAAAGRTAAGRRARPPRCPPAGPPSSTRAAASASTRAAAATANGTAVQQYACNSIHGPAVELHGHQRRLRPDRQPQRRQPGRGTSPTSPRPTTRPSSCGRTAAATTSSGSPSTRAAAPTTSSTATAASASTCPSASTADSVQLVQYTCNGTAAQSFQVGPVDPRRRPGPRTSARTSSSSTRRCRPSTIQSQARTPIFQQQETNQFGTAALRRAVQAGHLQRRRQRRLLHPGRSGLGPAPDDVDDQRRGARRGRLVPGQRHPELLARRREPVASPRPAAPTAGRSSQAAPYRRMHVARQPRPGRRRLVQRRLHGRHARSTARSSSGSPAAVAVPQRRASAAGPAPTGTWSSSAPRALPANSFPSPPYTTVDQTPGQCARSRSCTSTRPAPTRCSCPRCAPTPPAPPGPTARRPGTLASRSTSSTSSSPARPPRRSTPRSPQGKNLLVTPGVYHLDQTLQRDPRRHRRPRPRPRHASSRTTASPR